jgi:5-methylcytosine-specific restriction endonuclease McrA
MEPAPSKIPDRYVYIKHIYFAWIIRYCKCVFGMSIKKMMELPFKTKEQQDFLECAYDKKTRLKEFQEWENGNYKEEEKQLFDEYWERKEESSMMQSFWRTNHPEEVRMGSQRRVAKKNNLEKTLTKEQWEETKKHFGRKCCYCGGHGKLQQEHFIPVAKQGGYVFGNILPSCKTCNLNKGTKLFSEWYPDSYQYNPERFKKINEFTKSFSQQYEKDIGVKRTKNK